MDEISKILLSVDTPTQKKTLGRSSHAGKNAATYESIAVYGRGILYTPTETGAKLMGRTENENTFQEEENDTLSADTFSNEVISSIKNLMEKLLPENRKFKNIVFQSLTSSMMKIYMSRIKSNVSSSRSSPESPDMDMEMVLQHLTEFSSATLELLMESLHNATLSQAPQRQPLNLPSVLAGVGKRLVKYHYEVFGPVLLASSPPTRAASGLINLLSKAPSALVENKWSSEWLLNNTPTTVSMIRDHSRAVPHLLASVLSSFVNQEPEIKYWNIEWPCKSILGSVSYLQKKQHQEGFTLLSLFTNLFSHNFDADMHNLFDNFTDFKRDLVVEFEEFLCRHDDVLKKEWTQLERKSCNVLRMPLIDNDLDLPEISLHDVLHQFLDILQNFQSPNLQWMFSSEVNDAIDAKKISESMQSYLGTNAAFNDEIMVALSHLKNDVPVFIDQLYKLLPSENGTNILSPGLNFMNSLTNYLQSNLLSAHGWTRQIFAMLPTTAQFNLPNAIKNLMYQSNSPFMFPGPSNDSNEIVLPSVLFNSTANLFTTFSAMGHSVSEFISHFNASHYHTSHYINGSIETVASTIRNIQEDIGYRVADLVVSQSPAAARSFAAVSTLSTWLTEFLTEKPAQPFLDDLSLVDLSYTATSALELWGSNLTLSEVCDDTSLKTQHAKLCGRSWTEFGNEFWAAIGGDELIREFKQPSPVSTKALLGSLRTLSDTLANFAVTGNTMAALQPSNNVSLVLETVEAVGKWMGMESSFVPLPGLVMSSTTLLSRLLSPTFLSSLSTSNNEVLQGLEQALGPQLSDLSMEFGLLLRHQPDRLVSWLQAPSLCNLNITDNTTVINGLLSHPLCEELSRNGLAGIILEFTGVGHVLGHSPTGAEAVLSLLQLSVAAQSGRSQSSLQKPSNYFSLNHTSDAILSGLFGITPEEYWGNNSTYLIIASLVDPLVKLSREGNDTVSEGAKALINSVNKVVKILRLVGTVLKGGDMWYNIKNSFWDKPSVIELFSMVENTPRALVQYFSVVRHGRAKLLHLLMNPSHETCYSLIREVEERLANANLSSAPTAYSFADMTFYNDPITSSSSVNGTTFSNVSSTELANSTESATSERSVTENSTIENLTNATSTSVDGSTGISTTENGTVRMQPEGFNSPPYNNVTNNSSLCPNDCKELLSLLQYLSSMTDPNVLLDQLNPLSQPLIGDIKIDVDTAPLSMSLATAVEDVVSGMQNSSNITLPTWLTDDYGNMAVQELSTGWSFHDTVKAATLALSTNSGNASNASLLPAHVVLKRLTNFYAESGSNVSLADLATGLPGLQTTLRDLQPFYKDLLSVLLWLPESKLFPHLLQLRNVSALQEMLCSSGIGNYLYHPSIENWSPLNSILCSYTPANYSAELLQYIMLGGLMEEFESYDGINGVLDSASTLMSLFSNGSLNVISVSEVLTENPYVLNLINMSLPAQYLFGLRQAILVWSQLSVFASSPLNETLNATFEKPSPSLNSAHILEVVSSFLTPLANTARDPTFNLLDAIVTPGLLRGLLRDYTSLLSEPLLWNYESNTSTYDTLDLIKHDMRVVSDDVADVVTSMSVPDGEMCPYKLDDHTDTGQCNISVLLPTILRSFAYVLDDTLSLVITPVCIFIDNSDNNGSAFDVVFNGTGSSINSHLAAQNIISTTELIKSLLQNIEQYGHLSCREQEDKITRLLKTLRMEIYQVISMQEVNLIGISALIVFLCSF